MEFSVEQIKEVILNSLLENQTFTNTLDISLFITNIAKKLLSTIQDPISYEKKLDNVQKIGLITIEELKHRELISEELCQEYEEVVKSTDMVKDMMVEFKVFLDSPPEVKKTMISRFICSCIQGFFEPASPVSSKAEIKELPTLEDEKPSQPEVL
jgi:hypothetical protein